VRDRRIRASKSEAKIHARRGKSLSQDALASAVGLTRSSISNIEKGRQKPLLHTLIDISEACTWSGEPAAGLAVRSETSCFADGGGVVVQNPSGEVQENLPKLGRLKKRAVRYDSMNQCPTFACL